MPNSLWPHGLYGPCNSPGQNTGMGSLSLLQGIFPTQRSNPGRFFTSWAKRKPKNTGVGSLSLLQQIFLTQESNQVLLYCRWILYQLSYQGSPAGKRCVNSRLGTGRRCSPAVSTLNQFCNLNKPHKLPGVCRPQGWTSTRLSSGFCSALWFSLWCSCKKRRLKRRHVQPSVKRFWSVDCRYLFN